VEEILLPLAIFGLRVLNYALGTVRLVAITRQRRLLASGLAAVEALVFAVVIANIVQDLDNVINLFAYCAGASAGSYAGMWLEARFVTGFSIVSIITGPEGHVLATLLRDAGFGVTETYGEGRDGTVTTLRSVVNKREIPGISKMVHAHHPDAFMTIEEARTVQRGWLRANMPGQPRSS
jgi:uncharacterized protein YebE (UPF0316 family)